MNALEEKISTIIRCHEDTHVLQLALEDYREKCEDILHRFQTLPKESQQVWKSRLKTCTDLLKTLRERNVR